jgi:hypothetical protein
MMSLASEAMLGLLHRSSTTKFVKREFARDRHPVDRSASTNEQLKVVTDLETPVHPGLLEKRDLSDTYHYLISIIADVHKTGTCFSRIFRRGSEGRHRSA